MLNLQNKRGLASPFPPTQFRAKDGNDSVWHENVIDTESWESRHSTFASAYESSVSHKLTEVARAPLPSSTGAHLLE